MIAALAACLLHVGTLAVPCRPAGPALSAEATRDQVIAPQQLAHPHHRVRRS